MKFNKFLILFFIYLFFITNNNLYADKDTCINKKIPVKKKHKPIKKTEKENIILLLPEKKKNFNLGLNADIGFYLNPNSDIKIKNTNNFLGCVDFNELVFNQKLKYDFGLGLSAGYIFFESIETSVGLGGLLLRMKDELFDQSYIDIKSIYSFLDIKYYINLFGDFINPYIQAGIGASYMNINSNLYYKCQTNRMIYRDENMFQFCLFNKDLCAKQALMNKNDNLTLKKISFSDLKKLSLIYEIGFGISKKINNIRFGIGYKFLAIPSFSNINNDIKIIDNDNENININEFSFNKLGFLNHNIDLFLKFYI